MWKVLVLALIGLLVVVFGFSLIDVTNGVGDVDADAVLIELEDDITGFARAIEPYAWAFPRDHGAHPEFQTEWWYYTGNLADESGRRFGFQFTIFRRALTPESYESHSEWRTNQVYLAHFTVSDIETGAFYHDERYARGGAGIAGATTDPRYRLWLENWEVVALNDDATQLAMRAGTEHMGIDFTLEQIKPPALQGDNGLSPKSDEPGNASYYYSLSRLLAGGTITVNGEAHQVSGTAWMDHEFSTSALGSEALGWDWFSLQLDDNRELMLGQIRMIGGGRETAFGGLLIEQDGSTRYLSSNDFTIEATGSWTSPHTGATYPSGWEFAVDTGDETLNLTATPLMDDQELQTDISIYWEGAIRIAGDATGYGYAELTGYANEMTGRF
ncbi:MAG: lipocalin-like domain-containing protein [Chloroflexota bacterium]|nr:MAG: carotenoid 1,2-hydratase [Chloroflexota bacterium]